VLDGSASGFFEVGYDFFEHAFFGTCPGAGDGNDFALEVWAFVVRRH
jgi:hypothetical protein